MAPTTRDGRIYQGICDECDAVVASDAFKVWKTGESLRTGDLVICNNSFLFREPTGTIKSAKHLALEVTKAASLRTSPVVITLTSGMNLQFKRLQVRERSAYQETDLRAAVVEQLPRLGSIIFSLVGRIGPAEAAEVAVSGVPTVRGLRYAPNQSRLVEVADGFVSLGALDDMDALWKAVQSETEETAIDAESLAKAFEEAIHHLQESSMRPVDPTDVTADGSSILSTVVERMEEQVRVFSESLTRHRAKPADNDVYNELLRVAYNFADGARAFLNLMVGISDLKPLVSWLTVFEQVDLAHRFGALPFSLVGRAKPSLARYRAVIAEARNQAFHDLFAFDHPFNVTLPGDALRAPELHLFREYGRRNDPALSFEDRELIELLKGLSRTTQRPVPAGFWDGNLEVMRRVVTVVRALRRSLVTLAG